MPSTILDPYAELGLAAGASPGEVKAAYRELAFELHPDRAGGDPDAAERLLRVNQAYELLTRTRQGPQVIYVPTEPPPPPRRVPVRLIARIGLAACVLALAGGIYLGRSGGADLDAARADGLRAGHISGERTERRVRRRAAFDAARRTAYQQTLHDHGVPDPGDGDPDD